MPFVITDFASILFAELGNEDDHYDQIELRNRSSRFVPSRTGNEHFTFTPTVFHAFGKFYWFVGTADAGRAHH